MTNAERRKRDRQIYQRYLDREQRPRIAEEYGVSVSTVDRAIRKGRVGGLDAVMEERAAHDQLEKLDAQIATLEAQEPIAETPAQRLGSLSFQAELVRLRIQLCKESGMLDGLGSCAGAHPEFVSQVNRRLRERLGGLGIVRPIIDAAIDEVIACYASFSVPPPR
jgi:transposase